MAAHMALERPKPNYYKQEIRYQLNQRDQTETTSNDLNIWKHYLYELQQKAPTPKRVLCRRDVPHKPAYYGREY
ncbi:unnamed protein product, partial [Oppiella nova]